VEGRNYARGEPGEILTNRNCNTMTSTPPENEWTAEDLANQKRVADEVEKIIVWMHLRMLVGILAAGAILAVAIHFLSTP
jgi:hypothetical protein